jgi:nitroreductase
MTHPKHAAADHEVLEIIRRRWSPRAFDANRAVPAAELARLFEAARWAPSSGNEQPWRFLVADRARASGLHAGLVGTLTGKNPAWAGAAPVLVLACVRVTLERGETPNPHAWYDTGQAVALLTLQATSQGLSVRQMEGFDRERARQAANVPAPFEPAVVMAIGYSGDPESLGYEKHRAAELTPRHRRPIGETAFDGEWGRGFVGA